jgi:hypothetical protein
MSPFVIGLLRCDFEEAVEEVDSSVVLKVEFGLGQSIAEPIITEAGNEVVVEGENIFEVLRLNVESLTKQISILLGDDDAFDAHE